MITTEYIILRIDYPLLPSVSDSALLLKHWSLSAGQFHPSFFISACHSILDSRVAEIIDIPIYATAP